VKSSYCETINLKNLLTDLKGFEDAMISSCYHRHLTPSVPFQTRIAQFIQLLQENRMVCNMLYVVCAVCVYVTM